MMLYNRKRIQSASSYAMLVLLGCISLPLFAATYNMSAKLLAFALAFNYSYSSDDPYSSNAPSGISPSHLPAGQLASYQYLSTPVVVGQPYEYKLTITPNNNYLTNSLQIYETASAQSLTEPVGGGGTPVNLGDAANTYYDGKFATLCGTAANPILYGWDCPGPGLTSAESIANNTSVLFYQFTEQLSSIPMYKYNGAWKSGTGGNPASTETIQVECTYYTNTVAGQPPTTSSVNHWDGHPHWFGGHTP